jgi:S-DNA-T family DNA segregation ATPase FtsK/SpoIIIE
LSILMTKRPEDLQFILVDPKMVELSAYEGIPHLLCPVVTDMKRAPWILEWATKQMDERYDMLSAMAVRHIAQYNALGEEEVRKRIGPDGEYDRVPFHLPYIVIIIDELADLMMSSAREVENSITRLAQKSRAVGIHILVATQRPSVDVITGLIKANMPTRISFQVASKIDSRTILDRNGAETLLGMGDMLFLPPGTSDLLRLQGTFVSDQEIKRIVGFVKQDRTRAQYKLDLDNWGPDTGGDKGPDDELYEQACRIVLESQRGSVSLLQRKLEIGYTRASRLVDYMAKEGIVGAYKGSKAREVLMTFEEWEQKARPEGYGPASLPDLSQ